ncbi:hypothetical protein ABLN64_07220, partial [Mycobacterium tuberculosis]
MFLPPFSKREGVVSFRPVSTSSLLEAAQRKTRKRFTINAKNSHRVWKSFWLNTQMMQPGTEV